MFGLTCPGNSSAGFSIRGEIHTNGYNLGLVKHEYSHFLFDNSMPQEHNPAFFVEGSVEHVTALNDPALYQQRLATARQRPELPYDDLILRNKDFYGPNSEANYAVCGLFMRYLLDRAGPEKFKHYCRAANKQAATSELYGVDFPTLVSGYKTWLSQQ